MQIIRISLKGEYNKCLNRYNLCDGSCLIHNYLKLL